MIVFATQFYSSDINWIAMHLSSVFVAFESYQEEQWLLSWVFFLMNIELLELFKTKYIVCTI